MDSARRGSFFTRHPLALLLPAAAAGVGVAVLLAWGKGPGAQALGLLLVDLLLLALFVYGLLLYAAGRLRWPAVVSLAFFSMLASWGLARAAFPSHFELHSPVDAREGSVLSIRWLDGVKCHSRYDVLRGTAGPLPEEEDIPRSSAGEEVGE